MILRLIWILIYYIDLASFHLDQVFVIMSLTNIVDKTRYQPPKAMYKEAEFCV